MANFKRYEMGRCVSCGDCNTMPPTVEPDGDWVKFEDINEFLPSTSNNKQSVPFLNFQDFLEQFNKMNIECICDNENSLVKNTLIVAYELILSKFKDSTRF